MITLYLYLVDLLTPVIFGAFNFLLNSEKGNNEHYIFLAIVFSTSVLTLSFINVTEETGDDDDYGDTTKRHNKRRRRL